HSRLAMVHQVHKTDSPQFIRKGVAVSSALTAGSRLLVRSSPDQRPRMAVLRWQTVFVAGDGRTAARSGQGRMSERATHRKGNKMQGKIQDGSS
ncbi:hypothetical protein T310_10296, partial [Rasamsonia emersonii CBS 393.64]